MKEQQKGKKTFSDFANTGVELNLVKACEVHPHEGQPGDHATC